jgi:serine/threonine protein phosphatase PrpC
MWTDHIHHLKEDIFSWLSRPVAEVGSQGVDALGSAVASVKGGTRKENQDCAVAVHYCAGPHGPNVTGFILCDGIGGMLEGGTCARLATAMFVASLVGHKFEKALPRGMRSVRAANDEVFKMYHENGGTTLSCVVFQDEKDAMALNIGDSRVYQFRSDGISQLTVDDTVANQIKQIRPGDSGQPNPTFGKQLTQFIGMGSDAEYRHFDLRKEPDDAGYLLTSDGVHSMNGDTFRDITLCAATPLEIVKRLTAVARWGKSNDNGTVLCVGRHRAISLQSLSSFSERLSIWDSHSRLDVLLDTRLWGKERRPGKSPDFKSSRQRKSAGQQSQQLPDLHAGGKAHNSGTSSAKPGGHGKDPQTGANKTVTPEPLQLEIIEHSDDKSAN